MTKAIGVSEKTPGTKKKRSIITLGLRLLFGLSLAAVLIWQAGLTRVVATASQLDVIWLLAALLTQVAGKVIWAWRWGILLAIYDMNVSFARLFKGIHVGLFFNNFLPTGYGGDLYRAHWILDDKQLYRKSLFVALMDRFIGLVCLGYLALPAALLLLRGGHRGWQTGAVLLALGFMCAGALLLHPRVFTFLNRLVFRGGSGFLANSRRKLGEAIEGIHKAGERKWQVYALSFVTQLIGVLFFYCIGRAMNLPVEAWKYFVVVPLVVVATMVPISFNALGSREAALVILMPLLDGEVTADQSIVMGLLSAAVVLVISMVGGGFYIAGRGKKVPLA